MRRWDAGGVVVIVGMAVLVGIGIYNERKLRHLEPKSYVETLTVREKVVYDRGYRDGYGIGLNDGGDLGRASERDRLSQGRN